MKNIFAVIYFREGGEGRCLELEGFGFEIHADRIQTGPGFRVSLSSSPPVPRKTENMHNWGEGGGRTGGTKTQNWLAAIT